MKKKKKDENGEEGIKQTEEAQVDAQGNRIDSVATTHKDEPLQANEVRLLSGITG